ncbi:hypothetical protein F5878DRAFT_431276 [Lentinula raphanica]|uniref:F-box domain-containing protein n=1 Tax=Lentinula raphanica TaxID=153919 RepID=A0AA38PFI5_9AGAR|nr:hypothetical protein F5878DRAFT_431276 [Lentinula raphanica]
MTLCLLNLIHAQATGIRTCSRYALELPSQPKNRSPSPARENRLGYRCCGKEESQDMERGRVRLQAASRTTFAHLLVMPKRVCSPWRTSAVGTRMLWTDINITLEQPYDVQPGLDKMETYLTRSGPSSLFAVRLDIGDHLDFAPFLKLIASHISRCAHLSICVQKHTRACVPLIHECLDSLWAPHLGYLALHIEWVEGAHDRMMYGAPSILKAGAPSLNHLQLTGYASGLLPPISGGITTLHLDGEYMSTLTLLEYREILAANPRLVNLSLQWLEVESSMSTDLRAVELPMLRSLRIRTDESYHSFTTSTKALLSVLPLSSLESLVLYDTVDDLDSFEFPNVKDLALHYCTFPDDQIAIDHLMLAFPSVVRLTLQHKSILYKALGVHREPVMWPKLRTLCIRELDAMSFVEDSPNWCKNAPE